MTDCAIDFDVAQPGLAQTLSCPFTVPADTYVSVGVQWGSSFDLLIDDPVDNIYTDPSAPTLVTSTPPVGSAQAITVPNPAGLDGTMGIQVTPLATPLVADGSSDVTVSIVLSALQAFQVNVNAGTVTLGVDGKGSAGFCDSVSSVGNPAAIAYYVNPAIGTPYSYNPSVLGAANPASIGVLYGEGMVATDLAILFNGSPGATCGPFDQDFVFAGSGGGYLGVDGSGVIGWAGVETGPSLTYTALMDMQQVSTLGATTTFNCQSTAVDPMPPGGAFTTAPPAITAPTFTSSMVLVAH
jgi:hypothetical protein